MSEGTIHIDLEWCGHAFIKSCTICPMYYSKLHPIMINNKETWKCINCGFEDDAIHLKAFCKTPVISCDEEIIKNIIE